ncbi:hypothetical protein FNF31_07818 [Cafeteria roenbergensis]|uniref:Uncharacterized protein n=1 Tax=Cafeteria roenbergensis TaxID=33653 RepID=A0A5A8C0P8_CAFRO|nr:hypothetical protein FNF31_07818 [Cafeteria roenbergensis]
MPQDQGKLSADGWAVLGVTIVGIAAASFLGLKQAEVQKKQAEVQEKQAEVQKMVAKWRRDDLDAKAQVRAEKMRHTAAQVHECAADAFAFAEQAHFEAVRSNYRSARPLSFESMERMRDAHAAALREQQSDGKHPPLSTLLDAPLRNERLAMWRAVTLYYAASTVLHSLDEEAVAIDGGVRSAAERRLRFEDDVNTARSWLVQARARAAHVDAKVLGTWEPDLAHRIDLRLADASSYWHAVLGDKVAATQVYEDMGRKLEDASRAPGPEPRKARLLSNHAMALFDLETPEGDAGAVRKLDKALAWLAPSETAGPTGSIDHALSVSAGHPDAASEIGTDVPETSSRQRFRAAMTSLIDAKREDWKRILERQRLTVPSMLLFVGALTDSDMDLVKHASDVVACAEAFLDSGRDRPWLRARGMVRVLGALFVALEHCPVNKGDEGAAEALASRVIEQAAKLATIREEPDVAARGGDFGAFAFAVAQSRMPAGSWFGRRRPRDVPFSEFPRARRMKVEAERLAKKPSRRADGAVLDTGLRLRIEKLLEQVEKLA